MKPKNTITIPDPLRQLQQALIDNNTDSIIELSSHLAKRGNLPISELFTATQRLRDANLIGKAIALYRLWLEKPDATLAHAVLFNLAVYLSDTHDDVAAETAYRQSLKLFPDFIETRLNLGTLLERQQRCEEALATWREILTIAQRSAHVTPELLKQALNNLGRLLELQKRPDEAEQMLMQSIEIDPKQPKVLTHLVHLRQKQCAWPVYRDIKNVTREQMIEATSALAMLSAFDDPALQLSASRRYVEENVHQPSEILADSKGYGHRRLRIGYLSSDLHAHAVAILTAELFELHDRSQFEVYGFCWSSEDNSPLRARIIKAMDHFVKIDTMSDEQAARSIRAHEIDILVDLHGLTQGTRPNILAWRPAPVQITYLGFPGPTALPCIDYVIADQFVLPPELTAYFTERPLYMPHSFQINDRQREVGPCPSRAECGLPEQAFVFCSFNNNFKITEEVFSVWMRILSRTPGSVLWLVADHPVVRNNLSAHARRLGVDPARLIFAERVSPAAYLARYQVADLFLDTLPFNAGTTASDALWAGIPLLTCSGRSFSARMAGSLLQAVDLPELITTNLKDYEDKAVSLAEQPEQIARMKQQLQANRLNCALFDSPQFVRDLEAIFKNLAQHSDQHLYQSTAVEQEPTMSQVNLYHLAWDKNSLENVAPGFTVIDDASRRNNPETARDDWREYWPIRKFLLEENLDDNSYYGFFSARFAEKIGLTHSQVTNFVQAAGPATDIVLFSPQPDMGAFFLNMFEQEELFEPGFTAASEDFFKAIGMPLAINSLVMDSRHIVFSTYFVAKKAFWLEWLQITEQMFAICEGPDCALKQALTFATTYPGAVQRKVFLMERIASVMLTVNPKWQAKAYNTFDTAWSASRLNQFRFEAVLSDALKIAIKEQGFHNYLEAFAQLRDKLR